jgi:DNA-binding beta-propeller fold protein YncE
MTSHLTLSYFAISLIALSLVGANASSSSTPHPARPLRSAGLLLVANKADRTLSVIDPDTGAQIAAVPEGGITGHEVIASPDGARAFVPIYGNSGVGKPGTDGQIIDVVDLATNSVVQTFDFGHAVRPHCILVGPADGLLYVTTELDHAITVIDPTTMKIVGTVPTGQPESHMLAISRDGTRGYTTNVGPGTVSVLDLVARKTIAIVPVVPALQRISISPDGRWVFTSDTVKPRLAVIDTATNKLDHWIDMPGTGYGTASTQDGKWLLVALPIAKAVAVIDLATLQVVKTISVPAQPQEILIRPDGKVAYVSCDYSHQVAAIDLATWGVTLIEAGHGADGLAWAR